MTMRKVCIIGLGYIGLPTAAVLASKDFFVHGADIAEDIVERVNAGDAPIDEPALGELLKTAVKSGRLQAFSQPAAADIYIVAVPTPFTKDRRPDLSCVESAARAIAPYLKDGNLVILESTCPVGTTERLAGWLKELRPDLAVPAFGQTPPLEGQIFIAYCPERVLPGDIINELTGNDRIAGGIDRASAEKAKEFYRNFVRGEIFLTDARTAELAKLAENSFRDVNIAFAN